MKRKREITFETEKIVIRGELTRNQLVRRVLGIHTYGHRRAGRNPDESIATFSGPVCAEMRALLPARQQNNNAA